MSDQYIVNAVRSYQQRHARAQPEHDWPPHLAIDSPQLGEEITSGDAFLAGISSCGVNLSERAAEELGCQ